MAGHLLPLGGEGGAVALLHRLDVHAHGDEDQVLGGGVGVGKREDSSNRVVARRNPNLSSFS